MGVVLTQHVAHGTGGLLVLGSGFQAQLAHGVNNTPLNRFEAVTDIGQRPVENHVHGIIQVRFFRVFP